MQRASARRFVCVSAPDGSVLADEHPVDEDTARKYRKFAGLLRAWVTFKLWEPATRKGEEPFEKNVAADYLEKLADGSQRRHEMLPIGTLGPQWTIVGKRANGVVNCMQDLSHSRTRCWKGADGARGARAKL